MPTQSNCDGDGHGIDDDQKSSEQPVLVIQLNSNGEIIFSIFDQVPPFPSAISPLAPPLELDISTRVQATEEFNQERTTI